MGAIGAPLMSTETAKPAEAHRDGPEATKVATVQAAPTTPTPTTPPTRHPIRRVVIGALVVVAIIAALYYGLPAARTAMTTVSTDDAYVNAHVTFVAPRIAETVVSVHVDDNDYVRKGDLLVVLDKDVEQVRVEQAEAALNVAKRTVAQQVAQARALAALAKANHFKVESAMTEVR